MISCQLLHALMNLRKFAQKYATGCILKQHQILGDLRLLSLSSKVYSYGKMPKGDDLKYQKKRQKSSTEPAAAEGACVQDLYGSDQPVLVQADKSVKIKVLAKPGSKHNSVAGLSAEGVTVQIAAPPVDGQANTELIKYMAKCLGIRKSDVSLDKGNKSRHKVLTVDKSIGLTEKDVLDKLESAKGV